MAYGRAPLVSIRWRIRLDAFTGAECLVANLAKHIQRSVYHGIGPVQHALARLGKGRNRAERLIELMSNTARHLGKRRCACDLHQSLQQDRGSQTTFSFASFNVATSFSSIRKPGTVRLGCVPSSESAGSLGGHVAGDYRKDLRRPPKAARVGLPELVAWRGPESSPATCQRAKY